MGKKSKKNAAKAPGGVGGGSIRSETGMASAATSGSKRLKCVRCLCNIKDTAKAHACPGCAQLYCWRCEKKTFKECPNGESCLDPVAICRDCVSGKTSVIALRHFGLDRGLVPADVSKAMAFDNLSEAVHLDGQLTRHALPFLLCGDESCSTMECFRCALDSKSGQLQCCAKCKSIRCYLCSRKESASFEAGLEGMLEKMVDRQASLLDYANYIRRTLPKGTMRCFSCGETQCFSCMDGNEIESAALASLYSDRNSGTTSMPPKCSSCHWASKPCTNPNCPKELGVPTKRCGGCRLDRYCSVECQAEAYPDHVAKCEKVQEKRAKAGKMHGMRGKGSVATKEEAYLQYLAQKYEWN